MLNSTTRSATDVGFGPYIDIFLPQSGADDSTDSEKEDGITYSDVDYLGNEIRTWDGSCANGRRIHASAHRPLGHLPFDTRRDGVSLHLAIFDR